MKKYLILFVPIFLVSIVHGQNGFGLDVGMGTSKAPMIAFKYYIDKNAPSIGFSYQVFNDALGQKHDLVPGDSVIGDGDYFYSVDIGYMRVLSENFSIGGEVSIGSRKKYQNIRDDMAASGGYHRINSQKSVFGGGAFILYNVNETFGLFAGYNSLRGGTFGLEIRFFREKQY